MTVPANLALCFATIERPQVAQRLIRSARAHLARIIHGKLVFVA